MDDRWRRRRFLASSGAALTLAGCLDLQGTSRDAQTTDSRAENQNSPPESEDTDGSDRTPTATADLIETVTAAPTSTAERIAVTVEAPDATEATVETSVDSTSRSVTDGLYEVHVGAEGLAMNDLTVTVEGDAGFDVARETVYARAYDVVEDTTMDVGAVYPNHMGDKWDRCFNDPADPKPELGRWDTEDARAMNGHVDQMQGHGITSMIVDYNGKPRNEERIRQQLEHYLQANEPVFEVELISANIYKWAPNRDLTFRENLASSLEFVRETLLTRENYGTVDAGTDSGDRPVVTFWGNGFLAHDEDAKATIEEEWGGTEGFVAWVRESLTVDDTDPYLVTDTPDGHVGPGGSKFRDLFRHYDAVTNWMGVNELERQGNLEWNAVLGYTDQNMAATRTWALEQEIGYIPAAFPGFDDRGNSCWGHDRHLPRDPERFSQMLDLAAEYRTDPPNRITVGSWSGWPEGHSVEPGSFRGEDYGTNYVERIRTLQE
jgi:hypothetical protein